MSALLSFLLAHPTPCFIFLPHSSSVSLGSSCSLSSMLRKGCNWKGPRCPALALHTSHKWREATLRPR